MAIQLVRAECSAATIHLEANADAPTIGWQLFDPETHRFLFEGEWLPTGQPLEIVLPPESGGYDVYLSTVDEAQGWGYARGDVFVLLHAEVDQGQVRILSEERTTVRRLRLRSWRRLLPQLVTAPFHTIAGNRRLIRSMVRRDIQARYRGSFGDVFWTVLNPLLLMSTYFFVFGVVLRTRFGADKSSSGFVLYFLAGIMPWLAFSEAVGRAPHVILEHRNFVKKLVFPLETLPINTVVSGLVSEVFALGIFLIGLLLARHALPVTALWLPVIVIPQMLFTLGLCWFLAALGVYVRDLSQIIGLLLTLWFFLTPICYPESSLPGSALEVMRLNPIFSLVRAYRAIFLEGHAPAFGALWKFWVVGVLTFLLGHAWFYKLRRRFADVI